jgi:ligand-binding SRPBCC domain-containing protein
MTSPRSFRGRSLFEAPVGEPLFRSWVLLGGVVPIDFDHLWFESIDPESGFVETSTMLSMSTWRHERRVTARDDGGSRLVDRITFTPRLRGTGPLLARVAGAVFRHRHVKLRAIFGARPGAASA